MSTNSCETVVGKPQEIKLFVDALLVISLPSPISSQVGGTPAAGREYISLFFPEKLKESRLDIAPRNRQMLFEEVKWLRWIDKPKKFELSSFH